MNADILRSIAGIEIFPVVSLLLFVAVFSGILVWAVRANRDELDRLARLPLDGGAAAASDETRTPTQGGQR